MLRCSCCWSFRGIWGDLSSPVWFKNSSSQTMMSQCLVWFCIIGNKEYWMVIIFWYSRLQVAFVTNIAAENLVIVEGLKSKAFITNYWHQFKNAISWNLLLDIKWKPEVSLSNQNMIGFWNGRNWKSETINFLAKKCSGCFKCKLVKQLVIT